jgi:DNA-binding phage protein
MPGRRSAKVKEHIYKQPLDVDFPQDHPLAPRKPRIAGSNAKIGWKLLTEQVIREYLENHSSVPEIAQKLNVHHGDVAVIISKTKLATTAQMTKDDIYEAVFNEKVPIIKAIVGTTLTGLLEWVQEFTANGRHADMKVDEARKFAALMKDVYEMSRLEAGESTQNIQVLSKVEKDVVLVLEKLNKSIEEGGDPFVSYPDIANGRETEPAPDK